MSDQTTPNVEQEARALGWVPAEEFRGDAARWVDAQTFVERGHTIMPLLKSNNKKLEQQLTTQAAELEKMKGLFSASQESIQALQEVHAEATKKAVEKAKAELREQLKTARSEGDVDAELQIQEDLDNLREQEKAVKAIPPKAPAASATPGGETLHPDFAPWVEENAWFGVDQRKTLKAMGVAQQLRADPDYDGLQGRAFFDKILEVMNESTTSRTSKVGESRPAGGGSGGGKKSYADLPAEAKDACERQAKRLVGEGRAYKDMNAWRSYYTSMYFQGE